jgi:hypothetical protein
MATAFVKRLAILRPGPPHRGVTAIPPSGGGLVEGRLFSLDAVFDEVVPFAV